MVGLVTAASVGVPQTGGLADAFFQGRREKEARGDRQTAREQQATTFAQQQALQQAQILNQTARALRQLPVDQRVAAFEAIEAQLEPFGIPIGSFSDGDVTDDATLEQVIAQTQGFVGGQERKLGRVIEGVDEQGNRIFFQSPTTPGAIQVIEGAEPPESEASITRGIQQQEAKEKKELRTQQSREQASIVTSSISTAIQQAGGFTTTGLIGALSSAIPGTPAFDLNQTLEPIRANIGFNKLQQMREASPTGGALGQVSDRENKLLQSVMGSFNQGQSQEQLIRNLRRVQVVFDAIIHGPQRGGFSGFVFDKKDFEKVPSGELYINGKTGDVVRKP